MEVYNVKSSKLSNKNALKVIKVQKPSKFRDPLDDELKVMQKAMASRLEEIKLAAERARNEIPKKVDHIRTVLQMPNVQSQFRAISNKILRYHLDRAFHVWCTFRTKQNEILAAKRSKRNVAAILIQALWRSHHSRKIMKLQAIQRDKAKQRMMNNAAKVVQLHLKVCTFKVRLMRSRHLRATSKFVREAVTIQTLYRGYHARGCFVDKHRRILFNDLRLWAHGSSNNLLLNDG